MQRTSIDKRTKTFGIGKRNMNNYQINMDEFYEHMKEGRIVEPDSAMGFAFHKFSQDALKITTELNNKYHTPEKIVEIFSELTGKDVDKSFRLFPPFYTDCGKNITIGKNVFINSCCKFQDQGGITIGDGCLIGHNVIITTLNHVEEPSQRQSILPKSVTIGKNVWIGANVTIVPGVIIGDNAIIGAGSVVVKDIPANTVAVGNPCKVKKHIKETINV